MLRSHLFFALAPSVLDSLYSTEQQRYQFPRHTEFAGRGFMGSFFRAFNRLFSGGSVNSEKTSPVLKAPKPESNLSEISASPPTGRSCSSPRHTVPEGKYVYWDHRDSLDQSTFEQHTALCDDSFTVCDVDSREVGRQLAFLQWCVAVPEITRMVLDSVIRPPSVSLPYLRNLGPEECQARFGCDPLRAFPKTQLNALDPDLFFLYLYLAGLSRKKTYTVDNTPKSASAGYTKARLVAAYEGLEKEGLLVMTAEGTWQHATEPVARDLRAMVTDANAQAQFFYWIESWTRLAIDRVQQAKGLDMVLVSFAQENREYHPCPVCSRLPNTNHFVAPEKFPLKPFHYCLGSSLLARPLPRDDAVQSFNAKEMDYSHLIFA